MGTGCIYILVPSSSPESKEFVLRKNIVEHLNGRCKARESGSSSTVSKRFQCRQWQSMLSSAGGLCTPDSFRRIPGLAQPYLQFWDLVMRRAVLEPARGLPLLLCPCHLRRHLRRPLLHILLLTRTKHGLSSLTSRALSPTFFGRFTRRTYGFGTHSWANAVSRRLND